MPIVLPAKPRSSELRHGRRNVAVADREGHAADRGALGFGEHEQSGGSPPDGPGVAIEVAQAPEAAADAIRGTAGLVAALLTP